jgi:hypothetical protein
MSVSDEMWMCKQNLKMKTLVFVGILMTMKIISSLGQDVKKCDVVFLGKIAMDIETLKPKEIENFLLTFNTSCDKNVEYSELSNELLFKMLDRHTLKILTILESKENYLKTDVILNELSSPVNDSFNIEELISKVDKTDVNKKLKEQAITKLNQALK